MFNALSDEKGDLSKFLGLAATELETLSKSCSKEGGDLPEVAQIAMQALKLMTKEEKVKSIYPSLEENGKRDMEKDNFKKLVGELKNLR